MILKTCKKHGPLEEGSITFQKTSRYKRGGFYVCAICRRERHQLQLENKGKIYVPRIKGRKDYKGE